MKSLIQWTALAISFAGVSFAALPTRYEAGDKLPFVPNRFIIEIDNVSRLSNRRSLVRPLDAVYSALRERGIGLQIDKEFNSDGIFTGAAVTLNNANDVTAIESTQGIKSIRPILKVQAPKPYSYKKVTDKSDPAVPADSFSTHVMTGVDKLHAQGLTGKGVKVGILDTGIDYTHPTLGGKFGPGNKVVGGYDFVGDDYNGKNDPVPDDDPLDQCNGHGTHVAGIIGANPDNPFDIVGVAPSASIASYRIFGCNGFVTDDVIVEALLRGAKEGSDILTLSLGGADGWTSGTASVVASRIAASGKIVTIAAGNDGSDGAWYSSSPGNSINAISVASVENTVVPLQKVVTGGVEKDPGIVYYSTFPLPIEGTFPIYVTSNDTTNMVDACDPLPDTTPDLSKFVTIIRRGTCPFVQKLENLEAKGGKYALIYDNGNGFNSIDIGRFSGNAALIQAEDGLFLVNQWKAGAPVTITFPQSGGSVGYPTPRGGLVSAFSSYGPSNDFYFKPAVSAPGGGILSTIPEGGYAVLSGTSMATPFVAGSAALLFEAKGKKPEVGRTARTLFESTAKYIPSNLTDADPLQTVTVQGAGLINVYDALHATTILSKGELILNDTVNFKPVQTFKVTNTGNATKDYKLSHILAGTALTFRPNSHFTAKGPVPLAKVGAQAAISPEKFTLKPGQSRDVTVRFTAPTGLDATTFPVFSGFIQVAAPSENPVHVSYVGGVGSLKAVTIIDTTDEVIPDKIPAIFNADAEVQTEPTNYTFGPLDYPTVFWRQVFGSPIVRVDLVDKDIKVQTNVPRALPRGLPYFTFPFKHGKGDGTFAQVKIVGPITEFPFLTRNDDDLSGNGFHSFDVEEAVFANGTVIPNGSYRILLRALKVTGDWKKEEEYEVWLSPIVGVQVPEKPAPETPETPAGSA
ncbi:pyrolysin [Ephemerocybe angulata]|uniref:Pyrolysin n=1 Tax=Ephemerocybe angulata TaxID=980116 RepID=A0A8H6ID43_9AGAR|nr:pyrolysin [Tulosesus angulatus]